MGGREGKLEVEEGLLMIYIKRTLPATLHFTVLDTLPQWTQHSDYDTLHITTTDPESIVCMRVRVWHFVTETICELNYSKQTHQQQLWFDTSTTAISPCDSFRTHTKFQHFEHPTNISVNHQQSRTWTVSIYKRISSYRTFWNCPCTRGFRHFAFLEPKASSIEVYLF